jgi:hypothetical protein
MNRRSLVISSLLLIKLVAVDALANCKTEIVTDGCRYVSCRITLHETSYIFNLTEQECSNYCNIFNALAVSRLVNSGEKESID